MPIHDRTEVDPAIFHAFHVQWVVALTEALNGQISQDFYYALPEQRGPSFDPQTLTAISSPAAGPAEESPEDFYRRKQNAVVVRHVSGDRMVAVIEIVSPGNKSGRAAFQKFVDKSASLLLNGVHLLIVDLFPPGRRDPAGLHAAIWDDVTDEDYEPPADKPLAAIAYEAGATAIRAYVQPMAVGDPVPTVPLFLESDACVMPPLDETYRTAYSVMPRRWREVLDHSR
jgi:hypothetical protein